MIPYGRQNITADDIKAVSDTLQSDFLTQGPAIKEFENNFGIKVLTISTDLFNPENATKVYREIKANKINIEIEHRKKSAPRYTKLMQDVAKDNPEAIIYILDSKTKIKSFASIMPKWHKLFFISIDELIKNINELGQIKPIPQEQSLFDSPI